MPKFKIIMVATKILHVTDEEMVQSYKTDNADRAVQIDVEGYSDEPDMFLDYADSVEFFGKVVG